MKQFKILHISDMHFRHNGRLFYSTAKKINNGLILNGHNVLHISDRDITYEKKDIFDIGSNKFLFKKIIQNINNFRPHLILFGHVDRLKYLDFLKIKHDFPNIRFSQWFIDPLVKNGPDYYKNKDRFFLKYQFCDTNFLTTSPSVIDFANDKCFFIPNLIDPSIDTLRNFKNDNKYDLFIAISNGVHRGILKNNYYDSRIDFIKRIHKNISKNFFGYNKNPVWGANFFDELSKCDMGLNLSRGNPIKYYSSARMGSLLGNGLLTLVHEDYFFQDFFTDKEMIFYKDISDLNSKIIYYKNNMKITKKIAYKGYLKSHKIFNNKIITDYMVKKTMGEKITNKLSWHNG